MKDDLAAACPELAWVLLKLNVADNCWPASWLYIGFGHVRSHNGPDGPMVPAFDVNVKEMSHGPMFHVTS